MKKREYIPFDANTDAEAIDVAIKLFRQKIAENPNNKYNIELTLSNGDKFRLFWNCPGLKPIFVS